MKPVSSLTLSRRFMYHCQSLQSRDAFMNVNTKGLQQGANPLVKLKDRKGRLDFVRNHLKEPEQCRKRLFGQMTQRLTCTWIVGREKYGEAKKKLMIQSIPRYMSNMVGASDIAWACMAASITGSLVFIDDATANRSSRMNCEVSRAVLWSDPDSTSWWQKPYRRSNQSVSQDKEIGQCSMPKSVNPVEQAFQLPKTKLNSERSTNRQLLKMTAVKSWQRRKLSIWI